MGSVRSTGRAVAVLPCGRCNFGVFAEFAAHLAGVFVCVVHLVRIAAGRFDSVLSSFEGMVPKPKHQSKYTQPIINRLRIVRLGVFFFFRSQRQVK